MTMRMRTDSLEMNRTSPMPARTVVMLGGLMGFHPVQDLLAGRRRHSRRAPAHYLLGKRELIKKPVRKRVTISDPAAS
jgi:hypothetical protein